MLGSVCHPDARVRRKAVDHLLDCVDIMDATGSRDLKLWFADGTNYPGQDDIRARQERLAEALATVYERLGPDQRMVLEYKFFEPSFYTTDVPDWGTAFAHCLALGPKALVVVDTGHHAPGTNIEFIVAQLLRLGKLGAFDFNSRFYADDDLMVGAADPFQLFRIMHEVVKADALEPEAGVAFMLDQCHNIEPKIPGQIRSVMNVQEATAKALLVDRAALAAAQRAGDVLGANAVLMDAYDTDVRPLLAEVRDGDGPRPRPDGGLRAVRVRREDRRRAGRRRRPGVGRVTVGRPRRSQALLERSNRLGADPRNTNYAGGNTSAKGTAIDPVTGLPVELLWVKGSGGDLGTLTEAGLAVLRLDRLRALVDVYPGVEREDEMVAAFDYCLHGRGGAAPSIDTAMHALVDAAHVDHLHPDSGIAFATAADGEALTRRCFGDRVAWVPWRRPGFQLGLDIAAIRRDRPEAIGAILGGHGITAWGETSDECEAQLARDHPDRRGVHRRARPARAVRRGRPGARAAVRRRRGAPGPRGSLPVLRGLASTDRPQVGHFNDADVVLDFLARAPSTRGSPRSGRRARTTSCAPRSGRWSSTCRRRAPLEATVERLQGAARGVPRRLPRLLRAARHARQPGDARRRSGDRAGPRRRHVQLRREQADGPGRGRVLRQRDQRDARRRGALDLRADRGVREVPHRVLGARGGQAGAAAEAEAARHAGRAA